MQISWRFFQFYSLSYTIFQLKQNGKQSIYALIVLRFPTLLYYFLLFSLDYIQYCHNYDLEGGKHSALEVSLKYLFIDWFLKCTYLANSERIVRH